MNIKALPSVGSAFFVAFVLWSRRFAVPLQKESLGGALWGAFRGCTCLKCTNRVRSTLPKLHQQSKKCTNRATLVHLRQVHPLKAPTEQEVHQQSYVGALETSAPPEGTP